MNEHLDKASIELSSASGLELKSWSLLITSCEKSTLSYEYAALKNLDLNVVCYAFFFFFLIE